MGQVFLNLQRLKNLRRSKERHYEVGGCEPAGGDGFCYDEWADSEKDVGSGGSDAEVSQCESENEEKLYVQDPHLVKRGKRS